MPAEPPDPVASDAGLAPRRARLLVYAERPRRRVRQLLADVVVLAWLAIVVSAAGALYDLVLTLQGPARGLVDAGQRVSGVFGDAAGVAGGVPFVGDDLAGALGGGTRAGESLVAAGDRQVETIATVATGTAWLVVLVAAVPVLAVWLALRARWVLTARVALALRDGLRGGGADADLLALRALSTASPARLQRAVPDAAAGWRRGDPHVLARLADLELDRLGLRGPSVVRAPGG